MQEKLFWIATLYRKIDRKITFDFEDPGNPVEGTCQFYAQTSIFNIKVCFLPNADILDYGNDNRIEKKTKNLFFINRLNRLNNAIIYII